MLLLVPAIRRGEFYLRDNGTPWQWPLYPLSMFVVIVVIAGIRTHAMWMSFGSFSGAISFEPFLLLPFALAILVLTIEFARSTNRPELSMMAMVIAPAMLLCGLARDGSTNLAIQHELQSYFGSATTLAFLSVLIFYVYLRMMRVRLSEQAVVITLLAISFLGDLPRTLETAGMMSWMVTLVAATYSLGICLRHRHSDWRWLALAVIVAITVLQAGSAYGQTTVSLITAGAGTLLAMMTIGALFHTSLATALRYVSAASMLVAGIGIVAWHFLETPFWGTITGMTVITIASIAYMLLVKRTGWLWLAAAQLAGLFILTANSSGWTIAAIDQPHWPIQSGLICLGIGLTITSFKTGVHRRLSNQLSIPMIQAYRAGF